MALAHEHFVAGEQVDSTTWRKVRDDLDDAGHDDCTAVVPGDPATGQPVRWHIVPPPGVTVRVPVRPEDTGRTT